MPTSSVTLTDYQGYASGSYMAYVSPWNHGSYKQGVDYTESIDIDTGMFPNSVVINSNWGSKASNSVYGFNGIDFGDYNGTKVPTPVPSMQLKTIGTLTETHDMTLAGQTSGFDVIDDMFLTARPGSLNPHVAEIEVFLHTPSYSSALVQYSKPIGTFTSGGVTWTVAVTKGAMPDYLFMPSNQADVTSATVDVKSMFDYLVAKGALTGNEYFNGLAIGEETQQGSGTTTINAFSVNYQAASSVDVATGGSPSASPTPTAGDAGAPVAAAGPVVSSAGAASPQPPATAPLLTGALAHDSGLSASDAYTNDPTLSGHAEANALVTFVDGARTLGATVADAGGAWTFKPAGIADGHHTIVGSETNAAGLTTRTYFGFDLDTTPPAITETRQRAGIVRGPRRATLNSLIGGASSEHAQVTIAEDGKVVGATVVGADGAWSFAPGRVAAGHHTFTASVTDLAGNVATVSSSFAFGPGHARHV